MKDVEQEINEVAAIIKHLEQQLVILKFRMGNLRTIKMRRFKAGKVKTDVKIEQVSYET